MVILFMRRKNLPRGLAIPYGRERPPRRTAAGEVSPLGSKAARPAAKADRDRFDGFDKLTAGKLRAGRRRKMNQNN
jgi:hypothetical protein